IAVPVIPPIVPPVPIPAVGPMAALANLLLLLLHHAIVITPPAGPIAGPASSFTGPLVGIASPPRGLASLLNIVASPARNAVGTLARGAVLFNVTMVPARRCADVRIAREARSSLGLDLLLAGIRLLLAQLELGMVLVVVRAFRTHLLA